MELSERQIRILSSINREGRVDVDQLAIEYTVTTQTIRRDLNELCTRGLAARIHGGAIPAVSVSNVDYQQRRQLASNEKESIGQAAAQLIPDHCSVILNIGMYSDNRNSSTPNAMKIIKIGSISVMIQFIIFLGISWFCILMPVKLEVMLTSLYSGL